MAYGCVKGGLVCVCAWKGGGGHWGMRGVSLQSLEECVHTFIGGVCALLECVCLVFCKLISIDLDQF